MYEWKQGDEWGGFGCGWLGDELFFQGLQENPWTQQWVTLGFGHKAVSVAFAAAKK